MDDQEDLPDGAKRKCSFVRGKCFIPSNLWSARHFHFSDFCFLLSQFLLFNLLAP